MVDFAGFIHERFTNPLARPRHSSEKSRTTQPKSPASLSVLGRFNQCSCSAGEFRVHERPWQLGKLCHGESLVFGPAEYGGLIMFRRKMPWWWRPFLCEIKPRNAMDINLKRPTNSCWLSRKCLHVLEVSFPSQIAFSVSWEWITIFFSPPCF